MQLTERIDYHIKPVGNTLELTSMTLAGYTAGVIDLLDRTYRINQKTIKFVGALLMCNTYPKDLKKTAKKGKAPKTAKVLTTPKTST